MGWVRIHGGSGEHLDDLSVGRGVGAEDSGGFGSSDIGSVCSGDSGDGHHAAGL